MSFQRRFDTRVSAWQNRLAQAKLSLEKIKESKENDSLNSKFCEIEDGLNDIKSILPQVEKWEETLMIQFLSLEQNMDKIFQEAQNKIIELDIKLKSVADDIKHIKELVSPMQQAASIPSSSGMTELKKQRSMEVLAKKYSDRWLQLGLVEEIWNSPFLKNLQESYDHLSSLQLKLCLLSFSVFPENTVVKKRPLIYWWIGESLITGTEDQTSEEVGEQIFQELIKEALIEPHPNGHNPVVNACTVHPWIRHMLISLARITDFFNFDSTGMPSGKTTTYRRACLVHGKQAALVNNDLEDLITVFNVNEGYLNLSSEWLTKMKKVQVLQLGRWQDSPTHHIEVQNDTFLTALGVQSHLKYLSLRGISRITELPPSVSELVSLEILDLRACHNLEKLPSNIVTMRKLTHLDLSECYLLESMPKRLDKLYALQVLKGFVVGNSSKRSSSKIDDLATLNKLRRLSLYISSKAVIQQGEFSKLKDIVSLRFLTITWGVISAQEGTMNSLSFPPRLEKLDLRGLPQELPTEWLHPGKLENLKKLYIRGGKLGSLNHKIDKVWKVKILRLKYLENLKVVKVGELQKEFPQLIYLEKLKCQGDDIEWSKTKQNDE